MQVVEVNGTQFGIYLEESQIALAVKRIGKELWETLHQPKTPVAFLGVLTGAFVFMADLVRAYPGPSTVHFLKASSYEGMQSSGQVLINQEEVYKLALKDKIVVIVEDIVDTGLTLKSLQSLILEQDPQRIVTVAMIHKIDVSGPEMAPNLCGFIIKDNPFLIGYGLDYDGYGRGLGSIYAARLGTTTS